MKIALLTDGIYPYIIGGMQKHSYFLAKYLAQNQITVDLYHYIPALNAKAPVPFTKEELQYICLLEIHYPKSRKFPGHYLYERYLYSKNVFSALKEREYPDFIYAKGFSGWALLKHKRELKKSIPIGVNFHGYEMFQRWPDLKTGFKLQMLKYPVKYHLKHADNLFSYGGKISDIIKLNGGDGKIIEIPTGIASNWLKDVDEVYVNEKRKFVFIGRSERRKGIVEINKVLGSHNNYDFEFHFIGPIEESMQLQEVNIHYHGAIYEQEGIKNIIDQMDILVCPSYSEGMPNVIMEGMARGLAIIATDVGAINRMVDSENGWLIKKDIKGELHKAINEAIELDSNSLLAKKRSSILKVKENYTWDKVIEKTIKELRHCIQS